jgi:hypothetical protein
MPRAMVTRTVASSLLAVLECWAESNMSTPPQEMQAIFSRFVGGGITALRMPDTGKL